MDSCNLFSKTVGDGGLILPALLSSAIKEIGIDGLRTVYLVGSAASEETTLVLGQVNDLPAASDIDVIFDLSALSYAKYRILNMAGRFSEEISSKLSEKGLKTHVSVAFTSLNASRFFPSIKPNSVFMFELTPLGSQETKSFMRSEMFLPNKADSFDLTISSLADYIFLKTGLLGNLNVHEKCYIIAKRCLTLLNSLMLFKGLCSRSYGGRFALANAGFENLSNVLTLKEISLLKVLTEFKLSGNIRILANPFGISKESDYDSLFTALESFFKELSSRILVYEFQDLIAETSMELPAGIERLAAMYIRINKQTRGETFKSSLRLLPIILRFDRTALKFALYSLFSKNLQIEVARRYVIVNSFLSLARSDIAHLYLPEIKLIWDRFPA